MTCALARVSLHPVRRPTLAFRHTIQACARTTGTRPRCGTTVQVPWVAVPRGASPSLRGRTPARWWWSSVRGRGAAPSRGHEASTRPVAEPRQGPGTGRSCAVRAGAAKRTHVPARAAVPVMLDQGRRGSCAVPLRQDRSCVRGVPSFPPSRSTDRARRVEQRPPGLSLHPRSLVRRHGPAARPTLPPDGRPSPGPSRRAPVPVQHRPTDPGSTFHPRSEPSARAASANVRPTARPARPERSSRCRPANPVEGCQGTSVGLAQILGAARLGSCRRRRR